MVDAPRAAVLAAAFFGLAGCSLTPRQGPTASAILSPGAGEASYDLVELTPTNLRDYLVPSGRTPLVLTSGAPRGMSVAPGDVLRIVVFDRVDGGTFGSMATGGTVFSGSRVDESGHVFLPYAGRVAVAGGSLQRAADAVRRALAERAVDPQVHVELVAAPGQAVLVTGDVRTPGRVTTIEGPVTVVDAIARAGGPTVAARFADVVIRSGAITRNVPYARLLEADAIYLNRGDIVTVQANVQRFTAMGALRRPGLHDLISERMSVLEGISAAGGLLDDDASPRHVFVFRLQQDSSGLPRPLVLHLDLSRAETMFVAQRAALLANDAIYVTNAPIPEFSKFLSPIIRALLVGRITAGLGG
ncbi:polysaccharide biosynthesis/export family protein [Roseomonas sp. CCTCC AB2023176]|uniref:polysaccharide biosynthesis/export family protein n=1 Tax=Roseomonas sp. CCTCC AB2023176 TaxID=3342640 RepID=UPI0035E2A65D